MTTEAAVPAWPVDGGICGDLVRRFDWAGTALGPIGSWPPHLRVNVNSLVNSPIPQVLMWGPDHVVIYNDAFIGIVGHNHPRALGGRVPEIWPEMWDFNKAVLERGLRGEVQAFREHPIVLNRNGQPEEVILDLFYSPIHDEAGIDVDGVLCTALDITETVRARQALINSRAELYRLSDALPILVAFLDETLVFRFANWCFLEVFGVALDQVLGRRIADVLGEEQAATTNDLLHRARNGETVNVDAVVQLPGDRPRTFEMRCLPRTTGDGRIDGVYMILIDVEDRKQIETSLRHSNERFRAAVDAVHGILWTNGPDGRMTGEQRGWTALTGQTVDECQGYGWSQAIHPDDRQATVDAWERAVAARRTFEWEHRVCRADGEYRVFAVRAVPMLDHRDEIVEWVGVHTDITDRRLGEAELQAQAEDMQRQIAHRLRAEDQLRQLNETLEARVRDEVARHRQTEHALHQAQKMESMGQLTGGVAHDFNNLLQVIAGNLQMLARDVAGNDRAGQRVDQALTAVARGAKLASQLLAFGRRQPLEPRVIQPGRLLSEMDEMLRRSLGETIDVQVIVPADLWNICVDRAQLESALLNLAINARDAMNGPGRLTIEMMNTQLDQDYATVAGDVTAGDYVMVAVTDTGCGMSGDIVARIFDPFFSTKPEGRGTGLGMSMVYGFVKQSGGHVAVYSEPGQGTTIRLYLPRADAEEEPDLPRYTGPILGGSETVLVVEDDDAVRTTVVDLLGSLGYRVLTARDAQSGLAVVESGADIDVLFTDVVMPGSLTSRDMARRAQEILPGLGVLFTSGYTENSIVHGGRLDPGIELLSKPYTHEALARRLRHVIANARQARPEGGGGSASQPDGNQDGADGRPLSILLVEDNSLIRADTAIMLEEGGHRVVQAGKGAPALASLGQETFDLLLTDLGLPDMNGNDLARQAVGMRPGLAVVYATGDSALPPDCPPQAVLLCKPYGEDQLHRAVAEAMARRQ
ncbi:hybrid sensor histidine kinase/response regulator [Paracoccus subflavus]|uniref:histidine kinase n=1 Tax=Paracoccus subflavus TaxID=2528244 RepID=A0A4V2JCU9_9RHOB|nr:PAS domain S-box protein [Paracoccus subflavus]TBN44041.1 hybrid sensor histidine kinase/response regulator [Paracoccus subflavus]